MYLSSEVPNVPVGAILIAVGVLAVAIGVAAVLSVGWGLIVGGLLALVLGVDACRDVPSASARGEGSGLRVVREAS